MAFNFRYEKINEYLMPVLPGASTVSGIINTTDIGKLCMASSNLGLLAIGSTEDIARARGVIGIVATVPVTGSTVGASTELFYVAPIMYGEELEADFSTSFSATIPATTDIGCYIGFSNTTTVAGAASLSMAGIVHVPGSTSGAFFRITGFDVNRRKVFGVINSSHMAL
jgi:hypothetical protein